jgi:arylsulfatase A-like enzyme
VPARSTIITGRHLHNLRREGCGWWGEPTAADARQTLPGLLTQAGYQTRAVGKMHYTPLRRNYGFEHMEILPDYYRQMARQRHLGVPADHGLGQNEMEPAISTVAETNSLTRWIVERSIDFLETRDDTRPFFLYTSFSKPHPPFDPCANYWSLYASAEVPPPVRGDWSRTPDAVPAGFMEPTWFLNGVDGFSEAKLRDVRRAYYALITQIDYNLGLLFARMREMGLLDNTLILFSSDHGEMLGDHHMGAKSVYFEGSAHVPMLVRPPTGSPAEKLRGARCDTITCLADIMPTCLAATGVKPPAKPALDGIDLIAAAQGKAKRELLHGEYGDTHFVMEGNLKYVFTSVGPAELMFDLAKDPYEQRDLIAGGKHARQHRRLRGLLIDRLAAAKHPAVKAGKLVATRAAKSRAEVRGNNPWPGFHSRAVPTDLVH